MELNSDFSKSILVHADELPWILSPMPGVERRMLERVGGEVARATSIVRYAPNSHFSRHTHDGGEEYIVLEGTFQDEHGDFPTGSYVRNPPTSAHTPRSEPGCIVFVKLWQFDANDRLQINVDMKPTSGDLELFQDHLEHVILRQLDPQERLTIDDPNGAELFVLDGTFCSDADTLKRWSWWRCAPGDRIDGVAGPDGARIWIKLGHLNAAVEQAQRVRAV